MKRLSLFFILLIPIFGQGQMSNFSMSEFYFGRLPSARAEAMGGAYCSLDGDMNTVFFNPAGMATIKGLEVNGSYASPYYGFTESYFTKANYSFMALGYSFNKYLTVGLSRNHSSVGQKIIFTDDTGNELGTTKPYSSNYNLTLASEPIKNLYVGLNTNIFSWQPYSPSSSGNAVIFDFGIIKKFQLVDREKHNHTFSLGSSIKNFTNSKINIDFNGSTIPFEIPIIFRLGANYQYTLDLHLLHDSLKTFRFILQGEFQDVFNSDYYTSVHAGSEFLFFDLLAFRMGYYQQKIDDYGLPQSNRNEISSFTYGFGLHVPLSKLTKIPLNFQIDYTSLPQPVYSKIRFTQWSNFTSLNLRVNWLLK